MKQIILGIIFIMLSNCCSRSRQHESQNCEEFEFRNLSVNTNNWRSEISFNPISNEFYREYILKTNYLKYYDPTELYFVCEISRNKLKGIVVASLTGTDLNMYFISAKGGDPFLLAEHYFSMDMGIEIRSKFVFSDRLLRTTIRLSWDEGFYNKDSITTIYSIDKRGNFSKVQLDSARIEHKAINW